MGVCEWAWTVVKRATTEARAENLMMEEDGEAKGTERDESGRRGLEVDGRASLS
jgi:hypothetical protein